MSERESLYADFDNRGYGGKRKGSGRKPSGRRRLTLWVTVMEEAYLRLHLEKLRGE